ncbi:nucleotidyltransferase domain-containing protein [Hydrogenophaga sp.]|uniref:nucleotidyltransferase domain-containing protein n=1 Tax=Hydrogenophaga sp. TaxID=1904254 RepID=UPI00286E2B27|nr:nucleotidyltransferase domain-containing protein [Hydrogenophaga sp.]
MDLSLGQLSPAQLSLLRERLQGLEVDVVVAAVFGSAARGELHPKSDIDLLVIAPGLSTLRAQAHYKPTGRTIGRPINLVVFSPEGWRDACRTGNPFPQNILARLLIPLLGELRELGKQVL